MTQKIGMLIGMAIGLTGGYFVFTDLAGDNVLGVALVFFVGGGFVLMIGAMKMVNRTRGDRVKGD